MFAERLIETSKADKKQIDEFLRMMKQGRLSYLLYADDMYRRLIDHLQDINPELMKVIARHRFYVEYKAKVI